MCLVLSTNRSYLGPAIERIIRSKLRCDVTDDLAKLILREKGNVSPDDSAGYFEYICKNLNKCAAEVNYVDFGFEMYHSLLMTKLYNRKLRLANYFLPI